LRLERVDGRSDDILRFGDIDVHPHRLRYPFTTLLDVRQYQIVHERDGGLHVAIVPRRPTADLPTRVRSALERVLAEAGCPPVEVRVDLVPEIAREPGHAAKLKLVRAEA
jgi:phenylacetate-coenzyme A ligase PaaK-like adenylate-forming protein